MSRCFYNSAIDKKTFQGLLVRGNQKKFVQCVSDPLVVKTRTFKATTNQISGENIVKCTTNKNIALCGLYNDNVLGTCDNTAYGVDESMKQIVPKVTFVGNHNIDINILGKCVNTLMCYGAGVVSKNTVVKSDTTNDGVSGKYNRNLSYASPGNCHTSDVRPRGVNNQSCAFSHNQVNNKNNNDACGGGNNAEVRIVGRNNANNSNKVSTNDMCHTVQHNAKVVKSPPNVIEYALLFDIDSNGLDSHDFNTIMRKNSWNIFTDILQNNCADFSAWKSQSDFQFGFFPSVI